MARVRALWVLKIQHKFQSWLHQSPFAKIITGSVISGTYLAPVLILTWAIIRHGERRHSDPAQCADRSTDDGFIGSPEFYGLGIRLGTYLQWLAALIANSFLPGDRRPIAGAFVGFALAFLVAMLLLVFQDNCTYTAEMIILFNIEWGGLQSVLMPYLRAYGEEDFDRFHWEHIHGLDFIGLPLLLPLLPIVTWFWVRLAAFGEVDFAPTPRGTSFFILSHVHGGAIRPASQFVAFLCLWGASSPVWNYMISQLWHITGSDLLATCLSYLTAPGFLAFVFEAFGFGFYLSFFTVGSCIAYMLGKSQEFSKWVMTEEVGTAIGDWYVMREYISCLDGANKDVGRAVMGIALIFLVWAVLAVEFTLAWNHISEVYDVSTTGQVIPLVVGIGFITTVFWKLAHEQVSIYLINFVNTYGLTCVEV